MCNEVTKIKELILKSCKQLTGAKSGGITICSSSWVFLMLLRCFPISQLLLHPFPFCPRASSFRRIRPHHGWSFRSCARTSSTCHPTSVFRFSQFLLSFCLVSSSYCFHHFPLLFPLSLRMCRHHSYCSYCFLLHLYCRVDYYKYSCMLQSYFRTRISFISELFL